MYRFVMYTIKKGTWEAVFDQTGFYPEGGGQPYDTGTINGISVLSVHERAEEIVHELAEPIEAGIRAEGIIDWNRRYDLMQQHTGEHILSGLVHRHFGYDNVGFHMGADEVTIDFNGVLTQEQLEMLEDEANEIVYANVPVKVLYPSDEELKIWNTGVKRAYRAGAYCGNPRRGCVRLLRNPCRTYGRSGYNQNKDDDPL